MENLLLLTHLLAVTVGFITVIISIRLVRFHRTAFFRAFLAQILIFNILIITGLILNYLDIHMSNEYSFFGLENLPVWVFFILSAAEFVWLYSFVVMNRFLLGEAPASAFRWWFAGACLAVLLIDTMLLLIRGGIRPDILGIESFELSNWFIIGGAIAAPSYLLLRSRPLRPRSRSAIRLFGLLYLVALVLLVAVLSVLSRIQPDRANMNRVINSLFLVAFNLLPLFWIFRHRHLAAGAATPAHPEAHFLENLMDDYSLTNREQEVAMLVCSGKSNREIADKLFISLPTVKDHIYNVYRKTGVRNRVELTNLFLKRPEGEEGRTP
jgi:DNA-binding CsgD family transcriptional regulator